VSLSGSLNFVTIDEVLRLLTRSKQQGSLDVTGSGLRGRVFIGSSGVDLATIWTEDELQRHLVNSGLADESDLRRVTTEATTLAAIAESNQDIIDLVREMSVESLYQMSQSGEDFIVREGATSPYASPKSFELEHLIQDVEARQRDWNTVSELVPDLTGPIGFRRDLGQRDEVTIKVDDWKVLSEIGAGASVNQIAERLGTTNFWTAKVTSRLVQNDLVQIIEPAAQDQIEPAGQDQFEDQDDRYTWTEEPVEDRVDEQEPVSYPADEVSSPEDEYEYQSATDDTHEDSGEADEVFASTTEDEEVNPNESWWREPENEEAPAEEDEGTPEVVSEGLSEMPSTADAEEVEEDTEAFLEKVFSELESSEPESDEGHGLLRRRRMGSLRDFSSDS
jgi:hypothetical protein